MDVGPDGLFRPGGVNLTRGHIGDVALEGYGHVLGRGGGFAQVDGDGLGDHHRGQDRRVDAVVHRGDAAAAVPCKQGVDGDFYILGRCGADAVHNGDHFQLGQGDLTGEDLYPLNGDGAVTGLGGHQGTGGIGQDGGVVFVQRIFQRGGLDLQVCGVAHFIGQAAGIEIAACDDDAHLRHRGGLAGCKALDA